MTRYMKWGIITRAVAFLGFAVSMASQWLEPLASSKYATACLFLGFIVAFIGVLAGRGMFFFKETYAQLEREELDQKKKIRKA